MGGQTEAEILTSNDIIAGNGRIWGLRSGYWSWLLPLCREMELSNFPYQNGTRFTDIWSTAGFKVNPSLTIG